MLCLLANRGWTRGAASRLRGRAPRQGCVASVHPRVEVRNHAEALDLDCAWRGSGRSTGGASGYGLLAGALAVVDRILREESALRSVRFATARERRSLRALGRGTSDVVALPFCP